MWSFGWAFSKSIPDIFENPLFYFLCWLIAYEKVFSTVYFFWAYQGNSVTYLVNLSSIWLIYHNYKMLRKKWLQISKKNYIKVEVVKLVISRTWILSWVSLDCISSTVRCDCILYLCQQLSNIGPNLTCMRFPLLLLEGLPRSLWPSQIHLLY